MEQKKTRLDSTFFKIIIVMLGIVLMGTFWLTIQESQQPVSLAVMPETPRKGEPILVSYTLNNSGLRDLTTGYQFYVDGKLLKEGSTSISPLSSKTYQYSFASPVKLGEKISFNIVTNSYLGKYNKTVSMPPFPPQVASSFISFASFSTTVMSSMATATYYKGNFANSAGVNTGLIISICLILLLIFLELAGAAMNEPGGVTGGSSGRLALQRFSLRFSTLTWILLIIFIGIVYTKIIMILSMS